MTITGAIVLFAVIWFMTLLTIIPIGFESQEDAGEVEPGTPAGAPSGPMVRRKMWHTTLITIALWAVVCGVILHGGITMEDIDWTRRWRE